MKSIDKSLKKSEVEEVILVMIIYITEVSK